MECKMSLRVSSKLSLEITASHVQSDTRTLIFHSTLFWNKWLFCVISASSAQENHSIENLRNLVEKKPIFCTENLKKRQVKVADDSNSPANEGLEHDAEKALYAQRTPHTHCRDEHKWLYEHERNLASDDAAIPMQRCTCVHALDFLGELAGAWTYMHSSQYIFRNPREMRYRAWRFNLVLIG